jgi:hypothetical protein
MKCREKIQFHFHVIVTFVRTQIYWTLRTFVLCRWPIATTSVDLHYSTVVEDRQLDVPGIPAHPLFYCKCFWSYDNNVCLYYLLLLLFTTNRFAVDSLVSQCGSCGLYSKRGTFWKVTDDSILTWLQRVALFLSLYFKSVCCVPTSQRSFSADNFPAKEKTNSAVHFFNIYESVHRSMNQ